MKKDSMENKNERNQEIENGKRADNRRTDRENAGIADSHANAADAYAKALADKLEALGLADESYVNQLCDRLEPILGES